MDYMHDDTITDFVAGSEHREIKAIDDSEFSVYSEDVLDEDIDDLLSLEFDFD